MESNEHQPPFPVDYPTAPSSLSVPQSVPQPTSQPVPLHPSTASLQPTHKLRARITVVPRVYHQLPQQQPFQAEIPGYSRWIASEEQPYLRTFRATETWTELDFGWLGRDMEWPGLVIVRNLETASPQAQAEGVPLLLPGPQSHQRDIYPGLTALGILDPKGTIPVPFTLIPPSEHGQFIPIYGYRYFARVSPGAGTARLSLTALPQ